MKRECTQKQDKVLYKIGMFASINHVTIKALRYYDEKDLLKPEYIDEQNGYRYYSSAQLSILHRIISLKNMGFSTEEIKEVQNGKDEKILLKRKRVELMSKINEYNKKLVEVEANLLDKDEDTFKYVILKKIPKCNVAYTRKTIKDYDELSDIAINMGLEMEKRGCICSIPDYCYTTYFDNEDNKDINIEMCEAVTELMNDTDTLKFKISEEIEIVACMLHHGNYNDFHKTYKKINKWCEKNGYIVNGYPREKYIDGVWNKDSEEEWLTEIQLPVYKKEDK